MTDQNTTVKPVITDIKTPSLIKATRMTKKIAAFLFTSAIDLLLVTDKSRPRHPPLPDAKSGVSSHGGAAPCTSTVACLGSLPCPPSIFANLYKTKHSCRWFSHTRWRSGCGTRKKGQTGSVRHARGHTRLQQAAKCVFCFRFSQTWKTLFGGG